MYIQAYQTLMHPSPCHVIFGKFTEVWERTPTKVHKRFGIAFPKFTQDLEIFPNFVLLLTVTCEVCTRSLRPRSHRTQSTSQQAYANRSNGTCSGQWQCSHSSQATQICCASCVNWASILRYFWVDTFLSPNLMPHQQQAHVVWFIPTWGRSRQNFVSRRKTVPQFHTRKNKYA